MTLCLIPARSGSRRLPGKNWLEVGGRSLVQRAADCAIAAGFTPHIVTDAPERCAIPGAVVMREPDELAGDDVDMIRVVQWALRDEDAVILLQPTSPLRSPEDVRGAWRTFRKSGCDAVVSVVAKWRGWPSSMAIHRTYERNGAIYIATADNVRRGELIGGWTQFYVMPPERSVDVDTEGDLEEARRIYDAT